jgi:HPt (histidine-containing phosphotransfer) domain-containing protein
MTAHPAIDFPALLHRCMDQPAIARRVLERFRETAQPALAAMTESVDRQEFQALRDRAHGLKGAAASIEAQNVRQLARALEKAAEQSAPDQCQQCLARLEGLVEQVLQAIDAYNAPEVCP